MTKFLSKHDLSKKMNGSALRIMTSGTRKRSLPTSVAQPVATILARSWMKTGTATIKNTKLSVSPEARREAKHLARLLEWMTNPSRHHGQQAAELAEKTLRRIRNGSITDEELKRRCQEFSSMRKRHIDRKATHKQRAMPQILEMDEFGLTAKWLTSHAEIESTGRHMHNCLAKKEFSTDYKRRLQRGEIALITLQNEVGELRCLLCIDLEENTVEEARGPDNPGQSHFKFERAGWRGKRCSSRRV